MLPTLLINDMGHDTRSVDGGFALLEAVLALAVLAMLAAAATLALPREPGNAVVCASALRMASVLESDRNAALRLNRDIITHLDIRAGLIRSDVNGRTESLPAGVHMAVADARPAIHFLADGTTSGLHILVHSRRGACEIAASSLTGHVNVARAEPPR